MKTVKLSKTKPQSTCNNSTLSQVASFMYTGQLTKITSYNRKRDNPNEQSKQLIVIQIEPLNPRCLPNKPAKHDPKTVSKIINRYIFAQNFVFVIIFYN
jgi:hypothetical protein